MAERREQPDDPRRLEREAEADPQAAPLAPLAVAASADLTGAGAGVGGAVGAGGATASGDLGGHVGLKNPFDPDADSAPGENVGPA